MAANMYRVGDYVYFETSATAPYQIRRIEELTKTPTGNVEAKVMCYCRRRDISNTLISQVGKHLGQDDDSSSVTAENGEAKSEDGSGLSESQRHQLRHRELFLSRQVETLPATTIRGKCSVTLFNEAESQGSYLSREDAFYYTLVYDSSQKTLLADRGEIRVGGRYQAEVQPLLCDGESDGRPDPAQLEELVWRPDNGLAAGDVDKFLLIARSVGTLARAVDACSSVRQPGLAPAAAAASRDVTQAHAHRMLHSAGYDLGRAFCQLVTEAGPLLCRDQLEDWSAGECSLFEEAMEKYGKDFHEMRRDHLPWKSMRAIVEYFYMWKTTDRHVQQKRLKASEAERKLKQVYIPNYTKPNPAVLYNRPDAATGAARGCEGCYGAASPSGQWYAWGPPHLSCRLCATCWGYWKRYGGLRNPTRLEKAGSPGAAAAGAAAAPAAAVRMHRCTVSGCDREFRLRPQLVRHLAAAHNLDEASLGQLSQQQQLTGKAKSVKSMLMLANATTRLARLLCPDHLRLRRLARRPFDARFDARPALRDLPQRYREAGKTAQQLLLPGQRHRGRRRLTPAELDGRLGRLCPTLDVATRPEILRREAAAAAPAADGDGGRRPRTFPAPDPARLAEFFRRLDEERRPAQPPTPPPPTHSTTLNGGGSAAGSPPSLPLPRKRPISSSAAAAASPDQHRQDDEASPPSGPPAAKIQRQARPPQSGPHSNGVGTAAAAAAAAEEIYLFGTRLCRAHLSGAQLRRAGRCPFKPLAKPPPPPLTTKPPTTPPATPTPTVTSNGGGCGLAVKTA